MIKLNPFRQSTSLCGPASLKMLLEHYGKNFSEEELAKLCKSTVEEGTSNSDVVEAIRAIGMHPLVKTDAMLNDLRDAIAQDAPVLVGWTSDDVPHFSVVVGVDETDVHLMDPEYGDAERNIPISRFLELWHDQDSKLGTPLNHWMVTIRR